jgi:hypothetical protein
MMLLSEYRAELQTRIDGLKDSLASGAAHSFEEYSKRVGTISGLRLAITLLEDLVKQKPKEERGF